jgi:hypothetical protein
MQCFLRKHLDTYHLMPSLLRLPHMVSCRLSWIALWTGASQTLLLHSKVTLTAPSGFSLLWEGMYHFIVCEDEIVGDSCIIKRYWADFQYSTDTTEKGIQKTVQHMNSAFIYTCIFVMASSVFYDHYSGTGCPVYHDLLSGLHPFNPLNSVRVYIMKMIQLIRGCKLERNIFYLTGTFQHVSEIYTVIKWQFASLMKLLLD